MAKYAKLKKNIGDHPKDFVTGVAKLGVVESLTKLF